MLTATTNFKNVLASFHAGHIDLAVEIGGYSRVFVNRYTGTAGQYDWLVNVDDYAYTIKDTDGGADQGNLTFNVQDFDNLITADFPNFVFEGKTVTVKVGLPGLAYSDWVVIFAGYIDTVNSENNNLEYQFSCLDVTGYLSTVVYQAGDDGLPTSETNYRTLNAHPLDLMLDILLNQLKLDQSLVNSSAIQAFRDGPYAGTQFTFYLQQPVAAADFILNQLLKPLGAYMFVSNGAITINSFFPIAVPTPVATLGPDNWVNIPSAEQTGGNSSSNPLINYIQWQFDKDDFGQNGGYNSSDVQRYAASLARYGVNNVGELTITADGMRSAFQGFFLAASVSYMIFLQYGFKMLLFDSNSSDCQWNVLLLESGDYVYVTHPDIPDRTTGDMGITNKLFRIKNKTINFKEGLVLLTLIDSSYLSTFGFYRIAHSYDPNIGDTPTPPYASASTSEKARYMFECNGVDQYSNGDAAHILG